MLLEGEVDGEAIFSDHKWLRHKQRPLGLADSRHNVSLTFRRLAILTITDLEKLTVFEH